ncbi:hypothetical protein NQ317_010115 [Molorchus minor]|uniref:WD repeat-containing protein 43 n=1 Tax=Molorchus minor TaxID=1323400 RepID=A0ABQ9J372_9CUCU|nr:hypothetical protein NQ317_010115 [Molorchus minor]
MCLMDVMMASHTSQFSEDGKYFACISVDGKLKIWDTISNSFEQEFTPDFHLTSPCTCLHFISSETANKKKKRRKSESNLCPNIVLGTTSGQLLIYSISKGNLEYTIISDTSLQVNCLSSANQNIVYTGCEQNIFVWSLHNRKLVDKWKGGNEKITAILAIPNTDKILTASKNIKLWDTQLKQVLRTFTGHSSDVMFLYYISPNSRGDSYFVTGSKGDRLLNCWNISENSSNKNAVASFLMEDIVQNISVNIAADGSTNMAATVRNGIVHLYRHTLNGKCNKPLKPKTTVQVVSDTGVSNELVTPIKIVGAVYRDDEALCIGHGTDVVLTFENIILNYNKKIQLLLRKDPRTVSLSKEEQVSKVYTPIVNDDVHYLIAQTSTFTSTTKRKNVGQVEVPMEKRLENLMLNKPDGSSKVPRVDNMAQLLVQGLHSKDKSILRSVLWKRDETVIRNTIKKVAHPVTCSVNSGTGDIYSRKNFIVSYRLFMA